MTASDCDRAFTDQDGIRGVYFQWEREREKKRIYGCKDVTFDRLSTFFIDACNWKGLIFNRERDNRTIDH